MKNNATGSAHQLLQAFPFAASIVTRDMVLEDANDLFLMTMQRERSAIIGRPVFDVFPSQSGHPSQHEASARACVQRVFDTGQTEETPIEQHDIEGSSGQVEPHFWQVINSRITHSDGSFSVLQIVHNRTEDVMAKRRAIARERIASDLAGVAFWDLDLATGELQSCETLARLLGADRTEKEAGSQWIFDCIHPDDRSAVQQELARVKAAGHGVLRTSYRVVMPDASTKRLVAQGEIVRRTEFEPARLVGMTFDMTEFLQRGKDLEDALQAKDLLIDEVNHRVKNSLQLVSSILSLEAQKAGTEARDKLRSASNRVRAIALIHSSLYQDDVRTVCLRKHLETLCKDLARSTGADVRNIEIRTEVESLRVPSDQAITLSLAVNELVTNSLKHGFPGGAAGHIHVSLRISPSDPGQIALEVKDSRREGTGGHQSTFPEINGSTGLGTRLIRSSVTQLGGAIEQIEDKSGWRTSILFPR
jgi:two-component sensor histidine kinase